MRVAAIIVALLAVPSDAEGETLTLASTAPEYLSDSTADEHLAAARKAGEAHDVDPAVLLSIAYYESRYQHSARTKEPQGKTSCGVMTPIPKRKCVSGTIEAGYEEGAAHLRGWLNVTGGNLRRAMIGYAGGYALLRACAKGPYVIDGRDTCRFVVERRLVRAARIRRAIGKV